MKILFVLELYYPNIGGNERLFLSLGESLVQKGHQVTVITTKFDKKLASTENYKGIEIIRLPFRNRFAFTFFSLPMILRKSRNSDIIHTTSYNAALPSWIASKLLGKKAIITFHEVWGKLWFKLPYFNYIERTLYYTYEKFILWLNFTLFIAVSDYTKNELVKAGVASRKVVRIYNGLKNEEYKGHPNYVVPSGKEFVYTYFGRLGSSKGIDLLLEASQRFLKKDGRKLLIISSDKPKHISEEIKEWIVRNNFQDKVNYSDHLPEEELKQTLLNSNCVVIPSYSEGFCYAAAECIAAGIPIIVSGKGALEEVVSGKFIVMNEMTSAGLEEALEKAYNNNWTKQLVKKFLLKDTVDGYLSVYSDLSS